MNKLPMKKINGKSKESGYGGITEEKRLLALNYSSLFAGSVKDKGVFLVKTVIKSTGKKQPFNLKKLRRRISLAGRDTASYGEKESDRILRKVVVSLAGLKK